MATIVILATGIAATVAAFAIVDTFLLRPVPGVADEASVVTVRFRPPGGSGSAYGSADALLALRDAGRRAGLTHLGWACCSSQVAYAPAPDAATRFEGANFVSSEYFATLGVTPIVGRLITDAEADDEATFVAVISERLWRRDFNANPEVVGRQIRINQHTFTIVGVLRSFRGWGSSKIGDSDVWAPLSTIDTVASGGFPAMSVLMGRLARGADTGVVEQALQQAYLASSLAAHYLAFQPVVEAGLYRVNQMSRASTTLSWALGLSATLVLLLASANGANLTLLRIGERQRSHAIRVALGAPLGRIAVPFVIESTVVGVISGVVGLGMARIALWSLGEARMFAFFPDLSHVTLDLRIVAAALVSTAVVITLVSLLPLLSLMRTDLTPLIGRTSAPHARLWTRRGLLAFQIALAIPIAGATIALHREVLHALGAGPAIDIDRVMAITVRPQDAGLDRAREAAYLRAAVDSLNAHGFGRVSRSYPALTTTATMSTWLQRADGDDGPRSLRVFSISPAFFDVVGARLLAGRFPDDGPSATSLAPIVISQSAADDLFGTAAQAVGQPVRLGILQAEPPPINAVVVAVVADAGVWPASDGNIGQVFHMGVSRIRSGQLLVRFAGPESHADATIRAALTAVSADVPITSVQTLASELRDELSTPRLLAHTGLILSTIAIVLAIAGSLAIVNHLVRSRRDDFAVRLALGATPTSVTVNVLRTTWLSIAAGSAAGIALYLPIPRMLAGSVTRTTGLDVLSLGAAMIIVAIVVTLAAIEPAVRAGRIQPAELLRKEA